MEMVLNNGFFEMEKDEMLGVEGGAETWQIITVATVGVLAMAWAPAVGVGMVVLNGAAIKSAVGTALIMAGGGGIAIGAVGHVQ